MATTPMRLLLTPMRFLFLLLLSSFSLCAFAAKPVPNNLEPLPPPPVMDGTSDNEPEVTITKETEQTVEEYRAGGKLYMIKIIPKVGKPYYWWMTGATANSRARKAWIQACVRHAGSY